MLEVNDKIVVIAEPEDAYESIFSHKDAEDVCSGDVEECVNSIVSISQVFTQEQVTALQNAGFEELAVHIGNIANLINAREHALEVTN